MSKGNEPAFPAGIQERDPIDGKWGEVPPQGLTKREFFAAMAMIGELASQSMEDGGYPDDGLGRSALVTRSVSFADALLAELEKVGGQ